jgi:hypothetical protein
MENIDWPASLDVKQEAALRAFVGLRRLGKEVAADIVKSFNAEPKLTAVAYRWAYQDACRRHLGRGKQPCPRLRRDWNEPIPDPMQEADLEAVEGNAASEINWLYDHGIEGLSIDQTRRVLRTMQRAQEAKERGAGRISASLRQQICRLRKETELPLNVSLL